MQDAFGPSWQELHEEVKASGLTDMRADIGNIHEPISIPSLKGKRILSAACGAFHSLFLVEGGGDGVGGQVYAAGLNKRGQMGLGHFDISHTHRVPTLVSSLDSDCDVISVHCGWQYSAVLTRDGSVFAFGSDQHGQFGCGEEKSGADLPEATLIQGPKMGSKRVKAISCGFSHILLAYEGGGVASAGCNDHGQLGRGSITPKCCEFEEIEAFRGLEVESVACGHEHSVVLLKNGSAYGFGKCQQGQVS
jgi:alpha-tubulin suppressor-like RCC1 family protein